MESSAFRAIFIIFTASLFIFNVFTVKTFEIVPQMRILGSFSGIGSMHKLTCQLSSTNNTSAVHWYKKVDDQLKEFYRFEREANPQKQLPVIDVPGVHVDLDESEERIVALYDVDTTTNGHFRCTVDYDDGGHEHQHGHDHQNDNLQLMMSSSFDLVVDPPNEDEQFVVTRLVDSVGEGSSVTIECDIDERPEHQYAYKWSKNGMEFYKFVPWNNDDQKETVVPMPGVHVNVEQSNGTFVVIDDLDNSLSMGVYKCEAYRNKPQTRTFVHKIGLQLATN